MVRVIYRWRVKESNQAKFKAVWSKTTNLIKEQISGARGSVLLQSHQDPCEFITIARWDKLEDWQSFWKDAPQTDMQEMHALAERLSEEVYEEIEDHTV